VTILARLCAVLGLLALGYCAVVWIDARLFQSRELAEFAAAGTVEEIHKGLPANLSHPGTGSPVAVMTVPRLGLSAVVVEGAEERQLKRAPGHIRGTSLPGQGGNVGVAGHRDTFFRPLRFIRKNDAIQLATQERKYHYVVSSTEIVEPRNVGVLQPQAHETLTLVTCYPFYFVGAAPQRFIVHADCTDCDALQTKASQ
jgi:sortase A